ncbi:MAG: hypothetical protein ACREON_05135, partial [Gemmatimonadaceae bacterium]
MPLTRWGRHHPAAILFLAGTVVLGAACDGDRAMRPARAPVPGGGISLTSGLPVPLVTDSRLLQAALFKADSGRFPIRIATALLRGAEGDTVALTLESDPAVLQAAGDAARLIVRVREFEQALTLPELLNGATVHRFESADTVTIEYWLSRRVATAVSGKFLLTQQTSAEVDAAQTPWAAALAPGTVFFDGGEGEGSFCTLATPAGTCGSITYDIAPFAPGNPFGTFQSQAGTGPSSQITILFSQPISSITATISDPTFAGNTMAAFDANGALLESVTFAYSGTPGVNTPDTKTIVGPIKGVDLIPAPADYVAYDATITVGPQRVMVHCTPSPTRGTIVQCRTSMLIPQPYTVLKKEAKGSGFTVRDSLPFPHVAGEEDVWQGEAVATSDVTVTVQVTTGGTTTQLRNNPAVRFAVQPRAWPQWQLTQLIGPQITAGIQGMTPYIVDDDTTTLGVMQVEFPSKESMVLFRPTVGPNRGLVYIRDPIVVSEYLVGIHEGLVPPPLGITPAAPAYKPWHKWYHDQNNQGSGTCVATDVATLLR